MAQLDFAGGEVEKRMPQFIPGIVPGGVEVIIPLVNGDQVPHMRRLCAAVIAADQSAGNL